MKKRNFILLVIFGLIISSNIITADNRVLLQNGKNAKIDYRLLYGYTNKWWNIYESDNLNGVIDISFESSANVKSLQRKLTEIETDLNKDSKSAKEKLSIERISRKSNNVNLILLDSINPGDINYQLSYSNDIINKLENLTLNKTYNLEALEIEAKWASNSVSMSVLKLYAYYSYLDKEEQNLRERSKLISEIEKLEEIKVNLNRGTREDLLKVQDFKIKLDTMLAQNKYNKQIVEKNLTSLLGTNNSVRLSGLLSDARKENSLDIVKKSEIPEKIASDSIRERTDVRYYLILIKNEKDNILSYVASGYPDFWITGDKEEITSYSQVSMKEKIQDSLYFQRYEENDFFGKKRSVELSRLIKNYNSAVLGAYNSVNLYLGNYKIAKDSLEKDTTALIEQKSILQDKKNGLDAGSVSKYDYYKMQYTYSTQELYNLQLKFNLFIQVIDLNYNLGGGLNEAISK